MVIKKAGLLWNSSKANGLDVARKLIGMLREHGCQVIADENLAKLLNTGTMPDQGDSGCDILFVLGGDGTLLSAIKYAVPFDIPMVGVNLGRMGFLTEIETGDMERDIERLFAGEYIFEDRMMLTSDAGGYALNEIAISRKEALDGILSIEICVGGTHVDSISGDGVIIATATGSTAYSLSAGGPIIAPGLDCFVITPVCPHTMNARCVVAPVTEPITVRILDTPERACAVFDGRHVVDFSKARNELNIARSASCARFVRLSDRNYFELLRSKLSEWTH